jgi:hypothetical protein
MGEGEKGEEYLHETTNKQTNTQTNGEGEE